MNARKALAQDLIRAIRKSLGESQVQFGARLGVKQKTVSHWERGRYKPEYRNCVKIVSVAATLTKKSLNNISIADLNDDFAMS